MIRSAVLLALLVSAAPAAAVPQGFKAKADSLLAGAYAAGGPGAAVIVTENGKTVYAAGRGLADVERKVPITAATRFRLGSITKQFTAAAILRLAEYVPLDDFFGHLAIQPGADFAPDKGFHFGRELPRHMNPGGPLRRVECDTGEGFN